jgi:hypothetical protein
MMDTPLTNDNLDLTPLTEFAGPALTFELEGLEIGVAEYAEGPTGCTVFLLPMGCGADKLPGVRHVSIAD